MIISEPVKSNQGLAEISPSGVYVASAAQFILYVRDLKTYKTIQTFQCSDVIAEAKWSPNSRFILCRLERRSILQVKFSK